MFLKLWRFSLSRRTRFVLILSLSLSRSFALLRILITDCMIYSPLVASKSAIASSISAASASSSSASSASAAAAAASLAAESGPTATSTSSSSSTSSGVAASTSSAATVAQPVVVIQRVPLDPDYPITFLAGNTFNFGAGAVVAGNIGLDAPVAAYGGTGIGTLALDPSGQFCK